MSSIYSKICLSDGESRSNSDSGINILPPSLMFLQNYEGSDRSDNDNNGDCLTNHISPKNGSSNNISMCIVDAKSNENIASSSILTTSIVQNALQGDLIVEGKQLKEISSEDIGYIVKNATFIRFRATKDVSKRFDFQMRKMMWQVTEDEIDLFDVAFFNQSDKNMKNSITSFCHAKRFWFAVRFYRSVVKTYIKARKYPLTGICDLFGIQRDIIKIFVCGKLSE